MNQIKNYRAAASANWNDKCCQGPSMLGKKRRSPSPLSAESYPCTFVAVYAKALRWLSMSTSVVKNVFPVTILAVMASLGHVPFLATADAETLPFNTEFTIFGESVDARFNLWLPDNTSHVRGLVLMVPGGQNDWRKRADNLTWQHAASAMGFGLVGIDSSNRDRFRPVWNGIGSAIWGEVGSGEITENLQIMLDTAGDITGHPELSNVPIALIGSSNGALNADLVAAEAASRTVAYASLRAGMTNDILNDPARKVPGVAIGGSLDDNASPTLIQDTFLDARAKGAKVAFMVDWGAKHENRRAFADPSRGDGRSWEAGWYWLAEAVRLRYPEGLLPSLVPGNPLTLDDIPIEAGWLGEAVSFESDRQYDKVVHASSFPEITPYVDFSGEMDSASWLPSAGLANIYRAITAIGAGREYGGHELGSPLEFLSPAPAFRFSSDDVDATDVLFAGEDLRLLVEPHEFDDENQIVQMEFFDGADLIGVDTEGPEWGIDYESVEKGIHGLVVIATDEHANRTSTFRVAIVVPEPSGIVSLLVAMILVVIPLDRQTN